MTTKKKKPVTRHAPRKAKRGKEELPVAGLAAGASTADSGAPGAPAAEIDVAAFDAHAAAQAEPEAEAERADETPALGNASIAAIDAVLAAAQAETQVEARAADDAPAAASDTPLFSEPAPVDPAASEPRKGGWPKGRPRDPVERARWDAEHGASATTAPPPREPVTGRVEGDPAKRARTAEREAESLRRENADLKARVDSNTHEVIRKGLGALIVMVSNIGARKYGEHMRVPVDEANECGAHVGNALIPFLGDYSRYMPLVIAVSACAAVAIPRLQYEEEIRQGRHPRVMLDGTVGPKIVA